MSFSYLSDRPVTDIAINDQVPAGLGEPEFAATTVVQDQNGSGQTVTATATWDTANRILTWNIASLPPHFRGLLSFAATVRADAEDDTVMDNRFSLASSLNADAAVSNTVRNIAVGNILQITKKVNKRKATIGDILLYTVTVSNTSRTTSINEVQVIDTLPRSVRYEKGTSLWNGEKGSDPDVSKNGGQLTYIIGTLTPGQTVKIEFLAKIGPGAKIKENVNQAQAFGVTPQRQVIVTALVDNKLDSGLPLPRGYQMRNVGILQWDNHDASEEGLPRRLSVVSNEVILTTPGIYFQADQSSIAAPGATVQYRHLLKNLSAESDTVRFDIVAPTSQQGWQYAIYQGDGNGNILLRC